MLLPLRVLAKTNTGVQPLPHEDASYRNTHKPATLLTTALVHCSPPPPLFEPTAHSLGDLQYLAVLIRMPAAELVDPIQIVRRDDKTVKLPQVTPVWICQAVHAVIMHCGLTPHTPAGGPERHNLVCEVPFQSPRDAGLPPNTALRSCHSSNRAIYLTKWDYTSQCHPSEQQLSITAN